MKSSYEKLAEKIYNMLDGHYERYRTKAIRDEILQLGRQAENVEKQLLVMLSQPIQKIQENTKHSLENMGKRFCKAINLPARITTHDDRFK